MHVFLTGPKQVGKSTLLNAILASFSGKLGGFRTVRLHSYLPGHYTVHLFSPHEEPKPTEENLLFVCGKPGADTIDRFERLGCAALRSSVEADLLLMDELGPHETEAAGFQEAVWNAVEGEIPVLGVLQEADSAFLKKIARHPNVFLLHVTEENRDALAERIPEYRNILRKR